MYVQEPRASTNYSVVGEGESGVIAEEGFGSLPAHTFSYQNVDPEEVLAFEVSYTKEDLDPSILPTTDQAAATVGDGGTGLAIGITVGVLVLLGGGAFWLYRGRAEGRGPLRAPQTRAARRARAKAVQDRRRRREPVGSPPRDRGRRRQGNGGQGDGGVRPDRFCRQCGGPLPPSSRFCPGCGTKL